MKKKRKVFIINLSGFIVTIISELISLGFIVFAICYPFIYKNDFGLFLGLAIIFTIIFVCLFIFFGKISWQWVVVDKNKITAHNLFGKIREIAWSNVEEVQEVPIITYGNRLIGYCYVFIDSMGGEIYAKILYNSKGRYIRILVTKRAREFLLQLKPDLKFTEYHGT